MERRYLKQKPKLDFNRATINKSGNITYASYTVSAKNREGNRMIAILKSQLEIDANKVTVLTEPRNDASK